MVCRQVIFLDIYRLGIMKESILYTLDDLLGLVGGVSYLTSVLYNSLLSKILPSTGSIKLQWEQERGEELCSNFWTDVLENIHTCFVNSRHCLFQFKISHQLHYMKTKLNRLYRFFTIL